MNIKCFIILPLNIKDDDGHYVWYRPDTGEQFKKYKWPVGAIWRAEWYEDFKPWTGEDGMSWCVMTPGGEWFIDGQASNCGSLCKVCGIKYRDHYKKHGDSINDHHWEESTPGHKCWCRHGVAPNFTVNKIGITCDAGAGSIQIGNYHGFLINGELTQC